MLEPLHRNALLSSQAWDSGVPCRLTQKYRKWAKHSLLSSIFFLQPLCLTFRFSLKFARVDLIDLVGLVSVMVVGLVGLAACVDLHPAQLASHVHLPCPTAAF